MRYAERSSRTSSLPSSRSCSGGLTASRGGVVAVCAGLPDNDVLGNAVPHLHTHLVPRYANDPRPGWPFPFPDPDPPAMPEDRLLRDAEALRQAMT
jgi:hypothetical protein